MQEKTLLFSREEIARRIAELGHTLTEDYEGKDLVVVGILKGAFMFMADLARAIDLPMQIDFVRVASYGVSATSYGEIRFTKDIETTIAGKDVLIVEDIVDTGRTVSFLRDIFARHQPESVRICALVDKKERRAVPVWVDYAGFEVASGYLVGYGLDYAEGFRNLPDIYSLHLGQAQA